MTLVSGKVKKSGYKRGKLTPEEQFNRAWQRVQNQQRKNELFIEEVTAFVADVEGQIGERERQYADVLYAGCRRLLPFCQRKSLSNWQREVLLSWLTEDFEALVHSPFAAQVDLAALQAEMQEGIQALNAHILELPEEHLEDDWEIAEEAPAEDTNSTRDMFEDAFAEFEEEDDDDEDWDDPFDDFFREQRAHAEAKKEKTRSLSQLLKGSSVNKLFRKLARVLHPDLEQDDAARERKHHLMVELIEAREGNDIPKIFSLYAEHVGESPLAELGGDLDIATQLLQEQYEELQFRQQELLMENPRLDMVYRRFHYRNPARVQRAIREHLAGLGQLIAFQEQWIDEATSLKKLKPYLEERYAASRMGGLLADFDILFDLPKNFR